MTDFTQYVKYGAIIFLIIIGAFLFVFYSSQFGPI